ncbi:9152_t:CDS:2 [Entrophospora sp. SA101]|nr:9152_t:CDS:2 [Entrophospora sp. SA101]
MVAVKKGSKKETKTKKIKKVSEGRGIIHGKFSFNNTILDLSKENGDVLTKVSAGSIELGNNKKVTGTKKATAFMAEKVAEEIIRRAAEFGVYNVGIQVKGIGSGRDAVIKRILGEKSLSVEELIDRTPIPHGEETVLKNKLNTSSFVFRRLPAGMGIFLANSLRQVLLKYGSGIALLGTKISDKNGPVKVEESVLAGVKEITAYLILNLKKIIVEEKKKKEGIFSLELSVENKEKKEKVITAGDFQKDKDLEIKNPELYLATLAPAASYCTREEQAADVKRDLTKEEGINIIIFDTDYPSVKGGMVNYQINPDVNSQGKPEEKLTFTITTNGAIKPKKALQEALELSKDFFTTIVNSISSEKNENHVLNNLVADAILHEKIETSLPMARSLTKLLAKLIKYAKQDDLHSRRLALQYLVNKKKLADKEGKKLLDKLFSDLKDRYKDRAGGYSRITKLNYRIGDNNLRKSKEYHGFLVINLENIPNEYVYSAGKNSGPR